MGTTHHPLHRNPLHVGPVRVEQQARTRAYPRSGRLVHRAHKVRATSNATSRFPAPDATGDTPAAAPARTGNDITGNDGGTSTATGGIQIDGVRATRQYDKPSVGSSMSVHVDYSGKKVAQGATFTVGLGEGLKVPAGLNKVPLKATTLDGTREETIGECTVTNSGLDCEITADIAATLGGNGDLKAAYVDFSATIDSSATGKKTVDITVAGTTYTVSMGDGVIGEGYDKNPGKAMYSDGMENGLHRHRGWLWTASFLAARKSPSPTMVPTCWPARPTAQPTILGPRRMRSWRRTTSYPQTSTRSPSPSRRVTTSTAVSRLRS